MRYFFQWIVLISLALSLAACGGSSGSKGDTGATGATGDAGDKGDTGNQGDTGDNGTIAVPSADSDLAITASATADTDLTLGEVAKTYTVSGTDNLSADSRVRYYAYFGSTATSKDYVAEASGDNLITWSACLGSQAGSTSPLDTRLKSADNCTAELSAGNAIGAGAGATQYMIICPGNEAGDATSCASSDLGDRGWGARYADTTDNVSRVFVHESSSSFTVTIADSDDNVTAQQAITHSKGATPSLGTASGSVTQTSYSAIGDSVVHGGKTYYLSGTDNGTLYEDGTSVATRVFVSTISDRVVLDSDGTNMIGIADNGTNIAVYNLTTAATPARVGINLNTSNSSEVSSQFCGAVGGGRVVIFNDNQSADVAGIFNSSSIDNTTAWEYSAASPVLDNASIDVHCAMVYAGTSGNDRTFFMAVDNNTTTEVLQIVDNTTALVVTQLGEIAATTADTIAITTDGVSPFIAVDNGTSGTAVYQTTTQLTPTTGDKVFGVAKTGPVDIAIASDNSSIVVTGVSAASSTTYPAVRVFYNE